MRNTYLTLTAALLLSPRLVLAQGRNDATCQESA